MKKINRQGFTLIELLAALVILGLLMAAAVPNVMGIISRNKAESYVEDAKKLATRAEYVLRSSTAAQIAKPTSGQCIGLSLGYLDNGEFNDPPNGGAYLANMSFVKVCNESSTYVYYVQLYECGNAKTITGTTCNGGVGKGISIEHSIDDLTSKDAFHDVTTGSGAVGIKSASGLTKSYCATTCSQSDMATGVAGCDTFDKAYLCSSSKADSGATVVIYDPNADD